MLVDLDRVAMAPPAGVEEAAKEHSSMTDSDMLRGVGCCCRGVEEAAKEHSSMTFSDFLRRLAACRERWWLLLLLLLLALLLLLPTANCPLPCPAGAGTMVPGLEQLVSLPLCPFI
jgi:hypothetical protein